MVKSFFLALIFCFTIISADAIESNDGSMITEDFDEWFKEWIDEWQEVLGGFFFAAMTYIYNYITPQIEEVISDFNKGNVTFNTFKIMGKIVYSTVEFLVFYVVGFLYEATLLIGEFVKEVISLIEGDNLLNIYDKIKNFNLLFFQIKSISRVLNYIDKNFSIK